MLLSEPAVGVPAIALATTVHIALAAVRNHRGPGRYAVTSLAFASGGFAAFPWLLPSAAGLAAGLVAHAGWFILCERWIAPPAAAPSTARGSSAAAVSTSSKGVRPGTAPAAPRPKGFVQAPVLSVVDESPDIRTFRLARPESFDFSAGQFLTVRLRIDAREYVRCYSISSPPEAGGYLEISVKRQGLVSGALHATLRPGSVLSVRPPAGRFRYPADDDRPMLLVAGGVGITPLISMLRHAALCDPNRPVTLLYAARQECDLAFRDELRSIAARSPRVRVTCAVSRGAHGPDAYPGRIDEALLRRVPDLGQTIALVCGPQGLIDSATAWLAGLGVPPPQIRFERFDAAMAASGGNAIARGRRAPEAAPIRLRTRPGGREIEVAPGQTLLEAAEQEGIPIPSLCRSGVCGTCRTRVIEGEVDCTSDLIDEQDRASGYVLACVASPRSDCVIEG